MVMPRDEHTLSERLGSFLYGLREDRNLSQRAAAKLIGISQARLASLEQGKHTNTGRPTLPSPEVCVRLAAAYGQPKDVVLLLAGYTPWLLNADEAQALIKQISPA